MAQNRQQEPLKCFKIREAVNFKEFSSDCRKCPFYNNGKGSGLPVRVKLFKDGRGCLATKVEEGDKRQKRVSCRLSDYFNTRTKLGGDALRAMAELAGIEVEARTREMLSRLAIKDLKGGGRGASNTSNI